jgi:signal transduction histidine kinase
MLIPARFRTLHAQQVRDFAVARVTARPMGSGLEVKALRADGTEFAIEASISHVHVDGQGLFTVMVRDVTEQRRAQAEATASRNILRAALASMSDAVLITDAQGQIVEANDACRTFLRLQDKSQCPRTLADFESLLDVFDANGTPVPPSRCAVPRALHGEVGSTVEFHLVRKDTGEGWIGSHNFAPIRNADGQIVGAVLTARDVTDLKRMHDELAASQADLRRLVAMQDRVQEAERKRIARELHDDTGQTLTALGVGLGGVEQTVAQNAELAQYQIAELKNMTMHAIDNLRQYISDLRPSMLDDMGLVSAVRWLAQQYSERTGIVIDFEAVGQKRRLLSRVETVLFRIAQEALNNVGRHAHATRARVQLEFTDSAVILTIEDDGRGFVVDQVLGVQPERRAWGLLGVQERVSLVGGKFGIDSEPGRGTKVTVEIPIEEARIGTPAPASPVEQA